MDTVTARILAALVVAGLVGAVLSTLWYAIRGAVWPDVPTARLPLGARIVQGCVEGITNLPGVVRAWRGDPGGPPGGGVPPVSPGGAS